MEVRVKGGCQAGREREEEEKNGEEKRYVEKMWSFFINITVDNNKTGFVCVCVCVYVSVRVSVMVCWWSCFSAGCCCISGRQVSDN